MSDLELTFSPLIRLYTRRCEQETSCKCLAWSPSISCLYSTAVYKILKAWLPFFCFLMLVMMYVFHIRLRCVFAAVQGLWLGRAAATLQL